VWMEGRFESQITGLPASRWAGGEGSCWSEWGGQGTAVSSSGGQGSTWMKTQKEKGCQ
jgi:hypothetical protein